MNPRYLHIGCGDVILPPPFENLDERNLPGVDHIGSAKKLSFDNETFDLVYSSHLLEHFYRSETEGVLSEWVRVLKAGCVLRLSVPCLDNLIKIYQASNDLENIVGPLMGGQTYGGNFHYNIFTKDSITKYLENVGCEAIHTWDFRRTSHTQFFDFSQATTWEIPISLNIECRKK